MLLKDYCVTVLVRSHLTFCALTLSVIGNGIWLVTLYRAKVTCR